MGYFKTESNSFSYQIRDEDIHGSLSQRDVGSVPLGDIRLEGDSVLFLKTEHIVSRPSPGLVVKITAQVEALGVANGTCEQITNKDTDIINLKIKIQIVFFLLHN